MRFSLLTAFAVAAAVTLSASPLAAQASGGVRIIVQAWQPANPATQNNNVVLDRPSLLEDGLNAGWAKARTPICNALKAELGKLDRIARGYSLYNTDCEMAESGSLSVTGAQNNVVTLAYRLPANMFRATTQLSIAGSYADPCAFFYHDLVATPRIQRFDSPRFTRRFPLVAKRTGAQLVSIGRGSLPGFSAFSPGVTIAMAGIWANDGSVQNPRNRSERPAQNAQPSGLWSNGRFD